MMSLIRQNDRELEADIQMVILISPPPNVQLKHKKKEKIKMLFRRNRSLEGLDYPKWHLK